MIDRFGGSLLPAKLAAAIAPAAILSQERDNVSGQLTDK